MVFSGCNQTHPFMIILFDQTALTPKKTSVYLCLIFVTCFLSWLLKQEALDHLSLRLYAFVLSLICTSMFMEMTHPSHIMLKGYVHQATFTLFQWFNGGLYASMLVFIFMLFEHIYRIYHVETITYLPFIHLFLDQIILFLFLTPLAKLKHQTYGYILWMLYLLFQYVNDYMHAKIIYAIIPFFQMDILRYNLAISYKLCYICIGCLIFLPKQRYFKKIKVLR